MRKLGIDPVSVLRQARLPLVLLEDDQLRVTFAQHYSIWAAIGGLAADPSFGLKLGTLYQPSGLPPSMLAAHYARDFGDALAQHARYLQPGNWREMRLSRNRDECMVEFIWVQAPKEVLPLLIDTAFAMLVEMGRRGTEQPLNPKRVELNRSPERTNIHRAYFKCPIKFRATRNVLIFHAADLRRPFATYNAELLDMLQQQCDRKFKREKAGASVIEQVKWILKRLLAGGRPDASVVAQELGLSMRTLQRRIVDEGSTFRELLLRVRQELAREYLSRPEIKLNEIAFLLGYEDTSSFFRAFHSWERKTPATWRAGLARTNNRQRANPQ